MKRRAGLLALSLLIAPPPLRAQQKSAAPPAAAPAPPAPEAPAPYEPDLLRLAEILGSLSYLRDLCGAKDGDVFRQRMSTLLDAEGSSPDRRARLAGAFNRGFHGYEATYRVCTPNAELVVARFIDEGGRIARDVASRFGGG